MIRRMGLACGVLSGILLVAAPGRASAEASFDRLPRAEFNRRAAELVLPLFWRSDANGNHAIDPAELVVLWGVGGGGRLADYVDTGVPGGRFSEQFRAAYARMVASKDFSTLAPAEQTRRRAVLEELAQSRPTLVETNLSAASAEDQAFADKIVEAAALIDRIYALQLGADDVQERIPADDPASRMLMYRNHIPFCLTPQMESDPDCAGLPDRPKKRSGLYPAGIQNGSDTAFCAVLEKRGDADRLMGQFTVVSEVAGGRATGDPAIDELRAVPYNVTYRADMERVSVLLKAAAAAIRDPKEAALRRYLEAAAGSFLSNDWLPADEAWARMSADNSKWYLRIGPDENYEDPCSRKSLFHVSFARINPDGISWKQRLEPRKSAMEAALAALAGPPYKARDVSFHLPDFIDIVLNAGESRPAQGATVGQSLPNGGQVANEGRGRTVAMVNLYTDKDSEESWKRVSSSLFCGKTMAGMVFDPKLSVMSTVLHEAAHNLGPSHEYRVNGRTAPEIFGGATASMLEELKAQTSALYFADWLVDQGAIDRSTARRAHLSDVGWAFGQIARGMYDAEHTPKPYSQLASIQMGTMFKAGVLGWHARELAANGVDEGCFSVDLSRWKPVTAKLEARVLHIKGAGDQQNAEALLAEFVDATDDWAKARDVIRERELRAPRATFVYSIEL